MVVGLSGGALVGVGSNVGGHAGVNQLPYALLDHLADELSAAETSTRTTWRRVTQLRSWAINGSSVEEVEASTFRGTHGGSLIYRALLKLIDQQALEVTPLVGRDHCQSWISAPDGIEARWWRKTPDQSLRLNV